MLDKLFQITNRLSKFSCWVMAKRIKVDQNNTNTIDKHQTLANDRLMSTSNTSIVNIMNSANKACITKTITYLQSPTKSQSDVKEYSVIKLPNGLTALLISDKSHLLSPDELESLKDENSDNESSGSTASESSSEEEDNVEFHDTEISGKPKVGEDKLAACALCIGVGSFSDPENIPGLAHFLEHMIFMGSEKYPKENEFDVYIKKKGGSDNASTECEYTTFYFDCHEAYLHGAMEIFSQLFISPLMKRESMEKEREAIESEFQMSIPSDESRRSQLLCSFADKSNPAHKFMWGNLITLRDNVKDDELYNAVHEFRKRHYSANRMMLAVQARLPLETLEMWVKECFENVPNNELLGDKFVSTLPPFKEEEFLKLYIIKPVKNINHLDLTWVMAPTLKLYKFKPLHYLAWIIGHEGKGSLLSYLRKKLWCFGITVSAGGDGTEENSIYSLFSISLVLTQEGVKHIQEILNSVFQYLKMLQSEGPQERIFREVQMIAETNFRFSEEVLSSDNVEQLSENMHFYPPTDYITGMELYFEYDPEIIKSFLNELTPDKVNIMISSNDVASAECLNKTEPWFGTKYCCKEIPLEWVSSWKTIDLNHSFHLPQPNPFLPTDFTILPSPTNNSEFPENVIKDEFLELWYKQDVVFKLPHAFCCLHLISPLSHETVQNAAMIELFISILKQSLGEELYPANAAQLEYGFFPGENGIVISVNGYNQKLKLLLKTIIEGMVSLSVKLQPDLFFAMKDELERGYSNSNLKTAFLVRDVRMSILLKNHWTALEKQKALKGISCDSLKDFMTQYFKKLFIQCLVQGNISKNEAIEMVLDVRNSLKCEALPAATFPEIQVYQLPPGEKYCVVQSFNNEDANSVVTNYYQSGLGTIKESCVIELLLMIMEEPLFDNLRTKQQLGYDVSCTLRETFGILGFSVSVHCQSDRNKVESVEARITDFLSEFLEVLQKTTEEDFKEIQESLVKLKNCADVYLKQEVKRNWDEIKGREYLFNRHHLEKEYIEKLTLQEVIEWFEITAGLSSSGVNSKFKKLSTQVVGKLTTDGPQSNSHCDKETFNSVTPKNELNFITKQETSDKFIFNLQDFRNTMSLFPPHKILV